MKQFALWILRPVIAQWLETRALRLPADKRDELKRRTEITEAQIAAYEAAATEYAISQIDRMLK